MNPFDVFLERGFVEQVTDANLIRELFQRGTVTAYIGFDPTAKSLHAGSLVPIMGLAHIQRMGHRPIALVGGGTGLVGDPSGKTEMRQMLAAVAIEENARALKAQLSRYLDFSEGKALLVNNADWLVDLRYIDFLRDIGKHFSVNRMLAAESYRSRLETGLTFIEFNYMLLQAYDFLMLSRRYDCTLQMGGNDQWGNILAGTELVRRVDGRDVQGLTFPLMTTARGEKMGKTHQGAVWLDKDLTSPYDFYQYWINADDRDVVRFLKLFTFLPMEEIRPLEALTGADLREAKESLAFEATVVTHGREEALKAREAARSVFDSGEGTAEGVPETQMSRARLEAGIPAYVLFEEVGLAVSRGAARRLIDQGGGYVNGKRLSHFDETVTLKDAQDGIILIRAGKKKFHRVRIGD